VNKVREQSLNKLWDKLPSAVEIVEAGELYDILKQREEGEIIRIAKEELGWSKTKTLRILTVGKEGFWHKKQDKKTWYVLVDCLDCWERAMKKAIWE